jgi:hypothetical protein
MEGKPITIAVDKQHAPLRLVPNRSGIANGTPPVSHPSTWGTVQAGSMVDGRKPKLLDRVREAIRRRHYSLQTEKAYAHWIKRFIFFHKKRHPGEMGETEIGQFLSYLATEQHVSASTPEPSLERAFISVSRSFRKAYRIHQWGGTG